MSWLDSLHPAKFKGIDFSVKSDKTEAGRTIVRHDFPGIDYPYIEDLGKASREFTIDAFIVGDDFATRRDALLTACETPGTGTLVHPYYGRVIVVLVGKAIVSHQADEGRMCVVSMSFVKTPNTAPPFPENDEVSNTVSAAGAALTKINAVFTKVFSVTNRIGYVVDAAQEKLTRAAEFISSIKAQARKLAEFKQKIGNFTANLNTLMLAPSDLVYSLHDIISFDFGGGNLTNPYNVAAKLTDLYELRKLFTFGIDEIYPSGTAISVLQDAANRKTINDLIVISASIIAARTLVDISFTSYNDAQAARDLVLDQLDLIMEATEDDDLFTSLIELKSQVVKNIKARAMDLSTIQSTQPKTTVPSLLLAYKLYGSIDREQDLIDRNKISNPCLIPGGLNMEVLSA